MVYRSRTIDSKIDESSKGWTWQATAYADMVSAGAPGRYRGLVLAWAPEGYGSPELAFDLETGHILVEAEVSSTPEPAALSTFRSGTTPNTYGEFRDDGGYVGKFVHEARNVIRLLFTGTDLQCSVPTESRWGPATFVATLSPRFESRARSTLASL